MIAPTKQMPVGNGLAVLALLAVPATAAASASSNAVVIDFDQGRLILGWVGLWLVAALTFALCANKRIQPMTRLARYLERRALRRARQRADDAIRAMAQDDPRILADLVAAVDRASQYEPLHAAAQMPHEAASPAPSPSRNSTTRGFRAAPLPGLPRHLQYLPG